MVDTTTRYSELLRESIRRFGQDPKQAYGLLSSALSAYLDGKRSPGYLHMVLTELDTASAESDVVTYTPQALNKLIDSVCSREVAGRLRGHALWHRDQAAALRARVLEFGVWQMDDPMRVQMDSHNAEADRLDAMATQELARIGGEDR
ncbi:hypothetical protein [Prauserella cavernicola]|uniref:Uncharacterized protein n=1 Tax=Prauserella cavernicola TaxID=2800127 RepID=A0A934QR01_9PSEU|nr:hypothetical protein [Prauserella cavernicola]MBK1784546.1 hypothetical protein [Prauserella cavernicola]